MRSWFDGKTPPEPTPKDKQESPRRWYCPSCDREIAVQLNLVPVNIDRHVAYRIAGFSVPSPCPWCGEPAIKEIAVEEGSAPPQPGSPLWTPGKDGPARPMVRQ